jgi:NAD(P)-dependent dehydrogenase (short-subunit alcohol dehydrogenase family)
MAGRRMVVVVTGAEGAVGMAVAAGFAAEGAVVVGGVSGEPRPAKELSRLGVEPVRCNVTSERDARSLIAAAATRHRRLDVLVNAAGTAVPEAESESDDIGRISAADWDHMLRVELMGAFLCSRAAAEEMREAGAGAILNVAGPSDRVATGAARAGLEGFTRTLARALAPEIRVNGISYWGLRPEGEAPRAARGRAARALLRRVGTAEDVARLARFLASEAAAFVTGRTFVIDGGGPADAGR